MPLAGWDRKKREGRRGRELEEEGAGRMGLD
jgi:hypothetical protein